MLLSLRSVSAASSLPPDGYADEHLPGAINIPLKTLDRETTRQIDHKRPVIVYCYDYQ